VQEYLCNECGAPAGRANRVVVTDCGSWYAAKFAVRGNGRLKAATEDWPFGAEEWGERSLAIVDRKPPTDRQVDVEPGG